MNAPTKTPEPEYKRLKIADLKSHKWAGFFPMQKEDSLAFKGLVQDIKDNGLREKVTIYKGEILEGRHRVRALELNGATEIEEYKHWTEYTGSDPLGFVLSANLHRRHLTTAQRATVAAKMADLVKGDNQYNCEGVSIDTASRMLNISRISVLRAKAVLKNDPELFKKVETGELTLNAAKEQPKPEAGGEQPTPPAPPVNGKKKSTPTQPEPDPEPDRSKKKYKAFLDTVIDALAEWPRDRVQAVEWFDDTLEDLDKVMQERWPLAEAAE